MANSLPSAPSSLFLGRRRDEHGKEKEEATTASTRLIRSQQGESVHSQPPPVQEGDALYQERFLSKAKEKKFLRFILSTNTIREKTGAWTFLGRAVAFYGLLLVSVWQSGACGVQVAQTERTVRPTQCDWAVLFCPLFFSKETSHRATTSATRRPGKERDRNRHSFFSGLY